MEIEEGSEVYQRIYGRSYVDNPNIALGELRSLKLLHYNFDHEIQMGELIVNADLEEDCLEIFREFFEHEYEIQSMSGDRPLLRQCTYGELLCHIEEREALPNRHDQDEP